MTSVLCGGKSREVAHANTYFLMKIFMPVPCGAVFGLKTTPCASLEEDNKHGLNESGSKDYRNIDSNPPHHMPLKNPFLSLRAEEKERSLSLVPPSPGFRSVHNFPHESWGQAALFPLQKP